MYIKYINSNPESLAYQAIEYEGENQDESNVLQLVHKFTPYYQVNEETQALTMPTNKFEVKKQKPELL